MSIEKIKSSMEIATAQNSTGKKAVKNRVFLDSPKDSVHFTGAAAKATKSIEEILLDLMPKPIKGMMKMHQGMGEIQNQLINAIGTGMVAPLFIKYNPFSDTDEDTRTYTAWRQPVSAVLAVLTQTAIVIPFNSAIKRASDTGYFSNEYNNSLFPSDDYLKAVVKAENPGIKFTKDQMKEEIAKKKKVYAKDFEDMISQDKIVFKTFDGKTSEMKPEEFKKLFEETIDTIIKNEQAEKIKATTTKLPKKIERGIFYNNNPKESLDVLNTLKRKLDDIYNGTDLEANPDNYVKESKDFNKECKNLINKLKKEMKKDPTKQNVNEGLITIIKEIKAKNTGSDPVALRLLGEQINHMIDSAQTMQSFTTTEQITNHVLGAVYKRTNGIDGTIATLTQIKDQLRRSNGITVKEAQAIIDKAIQDSENAVRTQLEARNIRNPEDIKRTSEWIESTASRLKNKAKSIARCIGEQEKRHVKANIDGLKRWTGLTVSLAILPATCWMLNKIYPWFMDLAFPELSNKNAKKGGK